MPNRNMEYSGTDRIEEADEIDHGIVEDNSDCYDEESTLASVLLESQSSFLLEQQIIYQSSISPDKKVDQNTGRCNNSDFAKDTMNNDSSFSQWYDYRNYNSNREVSHVISHASIMQFVTEDDHYDEDAMKDIYEEEEEPPCFHSFRKCYSRRQRYGTSCSSENNYNKMPSQSSIFTNSTCAETTATTASTAPLQEEEQRQDELEEIETDFVSSSSSFISDDMVILEQLRILRSIQEQQLFKAKCHHQSISTKTEDDTSFVNSKMPAREAAFNNFFDENATDEASLLPTEKQRPTNFIASASTAPTIITMTPEIVAMYNHDTIVPYPDGTTNVRVRGLQHPLQRTTVTTERRPRQLQQDENIYTNDDGGENVITTQCTNCNTLSQVVKSTCLFLFCVQCQEISSIVPISRSDVIDILHRQEQQEQF